MNLYQHIQFHADERVGRIKFARPPLNIMTMAMMREVDVALNECMSHHEMVAIVFEAVAGSRAWCAGGAIEEQGGEKIYQMLDVFHGIFRTLGIVAKPTVAVVEGAALGVGCELIAGCDIVIAAEGARFGQPEIKLGVFPTIATALLPRIIGERAARQLILTGELIDAQEAARIGLVTHVVKPERLQAKTDEILTRLRELSAPALEATRRALDAARGATFDEALTKIENIYLNELMKTGDAREGIAAFMEKRKPVWRNR